MSAAARRPVLAAALWMSGALASFLIMAVSARELSGQLTTFQILFFRSVIGLLVIGLLMARTGWHLALTRQPALQLLRNLAHFGGQYGWFYGIAFIPLAEVFAIEFTAPVWAALLAALLLGERLSGPRILAIVLGVAGVMLVLRPGAAVMHPAALAVLGGALGYALAYTLTKKLAAYDHPLTILFYMCLIQLPLGLAPSLMHWTTPTLGMLPGLLGVGLSALSAHYCLTRALTLADVTVVLPMDFLRLPLVALVGFLLYGEQLSWMVWAGAALILGGNFISILAERRRR